MSRIDLAREQLVAHRGPRRLPAQFERQSMTMSKLENLRGDERRGVAQRDEAEAYMRLFGFADGRSGRGNVHVVRATLINQPSIPNAGRLQQASSPGPLRVCEAWHTRPVRTSCAGP